MKTIKVFLASSAELDEDKTRFDLYFSDKNKLYRKRNIDFDQRTWKDFSSSLTRTGRLQDRYNEFLKECDIAVFLFHSRMGQYTLEELREAQAAFEKNGRKPRIFIYFKESAGQSPEMNDFKTVCESQFGHFCDVYENYDDLLGKFDRQLEMLENERFIVPDPVDIPRILRFVLLYVLLPVVILALGGLALYWFTPNTVTVKVEQAGKSPLAFPGGELQLQYADKTETMKVTDLEDELIFKEIHSRYLHKDARIIFRAEGFRKVDTLMELDRKIVLPVVRDRTYGLLFGVVKDEDNKPLEGAKVSIGKLSCYSDESGSFSLEIPTELQALEQRVSVTKSGYRLWDFTAPVDDRTEWKVILKR